MDRIGLTSIPIDPDRVFAIVESREPDNTGKNAPEVRGFPRFPSVRSNYQCRTIKVALLQPI